MPCYHQIQLKLIETQRNCINSMKKPKVLLLVFLAVYLIYQAQSHFNQREDIEYLKSSLSKLYRDFDRSMFTDLESMKEFLESAVKLSKPLISLGEIQKASLKVSHQIETLQSYEHDKTGRIDLALWNSGGRVAGLGPDTELFYSCNIFLQLIGCPFKRNGPEKLIEPLTQYGEFFRFKGKKASVFIKLFHKAFLDSVTVEHIPRKMSPTEEVTSAPRNFSVSVSIRISKAIKTTNNFLVIKVREENSQEILLLAFKLNLIKIFSLFSSQGMNNFKEEPFLFGNFIFNANKTSIETFEFPKRASKSHRYVKLDFYDNNGHQEETNVYRVRVHGVLDKKNNKSKPKNS